MRTAYLVLPLAAVLASGCTAGSGKGSDAADAASEGGGRSGDAGPPHDGAATDSASAGHDAGDGATSSTDGAAVDASEGGEGGGATDASSADGASTGDGATQGPCTAGAVQCSGDLVESCNSSGTAWLYEATCPDTCSGGLCTGACTPGATRCNGSSIETCNAGGTAYAVTASCAATSCSPITSACALPTTSIAGTANMDGVVVIDGDLVVENLATLYSPTGNLTIYAHSITVQQGGAIVVAATGSGVGAGGNGQPLASYDYEVGGGGGGGGYGNPGSPGDDYDGSPGSGGVAGAPFGSEPDVDVSQGGPGGTGYDQLFPGGAGGAGGGVLRLFANSLTIAGEVTANGANGSAPSHTTEDGGGGGGGAGGGILLAAPSITLTGTVSVQGGTGGSGAGASDPHGGAGGLGRIKILSSNASPSTTGTLTGVAVQGLLPPVPITSTSHPDPTLAYNDGFPSFDFSWSQPFPGVQGYYVLATQAETVPAPGNGQFVPTEYASVDRTGLTFAPGVSAWLLQVAPVTTASVVGTVESHLTVLINTSPPTVSSATNPSTATWLTGGAPFFSWIFPGPAGSVAASYYVLDHTADTIPDASGTLLPASQTSLQLSGVADGIWFFHLITQDTRGYFTKAAAHYQINLGTNPGTGTLEGQVVDAKSAPVAGATVSLNGGVYTTTTNSIGDYTFSGIPAVTWQVTVTSGGQTATATEAVTSGGTTTANLTL